MAKNEDGVTGIGVHEDDDAVDAALAQAGAVLTQKAKKKPTQRGVETVAEAVERRRVPLRVHPDTYERAKYWSSKEGISVNTYIADALEEKIARENLDYDLPTLEIARLAQLVDEMKTNSTNMANLERVVVSLGETIVGLTRGDNFLLDPEDGELDTANSAGGEA